MPTMRLTLTKGKPMEPEPRLCWHCCDEPAAPNHDGLCMWCSGELDLLGQLDTAIPNAPSCADCGLIHDGMDCDFNDLLAVTA